MPERVAEVERKFVADAGFVPDLGEVATLSEPVRHDLDATYYDTLGLDLTQAGWSLRRRAGGTDAGWTLKRPLAEGEGRAEVWAESADELPEALRAEAREVTKSAPLVPVAVVRTQRTQSTVRAEGAELGTLADDRVVVRAGGVRHAWEELEIELAPGVDEAWLGRLSAALVAAGARPAEHGSKVARALASVTPFEAPTSSDAPAGHVLVAYLAKQVGTLQSLLAAVRVDAPDAVHKSRVATRRLRSALKTFAPLFTRKRAESLRGELRWLGELLGAPRDAEVLSEEFGDLLAELGPDAVTPAVRHRLLGHLEHVHAESHAALVAALDTPRAVALRADLSRLLAEPPLRKRAHAPAAQMLPPLVDSAAQRVEALRDRARRSPGELDRWHEVRKAAKAVRYCTEALAVAFGPQAEARAERWTEVTEAYGVLQDTVVADDLLDHLEHAARAEGEPSNTWGLLRDVEHDRRQAALVEGAVALDAALAG